MPTADAVLLDTHVLLWLHSDPTRLSGRASEVIGKAGVVLVSPITCWEIAILVQKGRVALDRPVRAWVSAVFQEERVRPAVLTPAVAVDAALLEDLHGDPADRFLYATARAHDAALVSKDRILAEAAERRRDVMVVW